MNNNTTSQSSTQQQGPIPPRPIPINVYTDQIPLDLMSVPQWVCWKYKWNGKKWTKPPIQPNGYNASVTNPKHYSEFPEVVAAYEKGGFDGIGFVLTANDPFVGIDIDHCLFEDDVITDEARKIIEEVGSYTEISPSGTGIRIIANGIIPHAIKRQELEMYGRDRYLTMTGHWWRP